MIAVPAGVRILVASKPVDFRRGADSLAALVREQLRHERDPARATDQEHGRDALRRQVCFADHVQSRGDGAL